MKILILLLMMVSTMQIASAASSQEHSDVVAVNSEEVLLGPDGFKATCISLARFDEAFDIEGRPSRIMNRVIQNPIAVKTYHFDREDQSRQFFNVPFNKWTPEIVVFLKNSIDTCAANKNLLSSVFDRMNQKAVWELSPSRTKALVDVAYEKVEESRKIALERANQQEQVKKNQESARLEIEEHIRQLKNREIPIGDISDAQQFYSSIELTEIMSSPLLLPDGDYYSGEVTVDYLEKNGVLRCKIENYIDMRSPPTIVPIMYVHLRTDKKSVLFNPLKLRIGQAISVVGKYVGNTEYKTLDGEVKVAPLLQVLYMGNN